MSDIERRPSRSLREQRAYRFALATATFGFLAVGGIVLALVGVISLGLPILALIMAAIFGLLFRRTVS
jgi:hypothetical membrane protein